MEMQHVNLVVCSTPFVRAINKILITVSMSVSVYHLISYANSQKGMKCISKDLERFMMRVGQFCLCSAILILKFCKNYSTSYLLENSIFDCYTNKTTSAAMVFRTEGHF